MIKGFLLLVLRPRFDRLHCNKQEFRVSKSHTISGPARAIRNHRFEIGIVREKAKVFLFTGK